MKTDYASIPTLYNGIQFRSRLEARWAVLFDLLRWEWEYEPFDLNGWIPDFRILGNKDLLVEVKSFSLTDSEGEFDYRWIKQLEKIVKAKPESSVLLLSNTPFDTSRGQEYGYFGYVFMEDFNGWSLENKLNNIFEQVLAWGSPSFPTYPMPECVAPEYCVKGKAYMEYETYPKDNLLRLWNQAGNITQWKGEYGKKTND